MFACTIVTYGYTDQEVEALLKFKDSLFNTTALNNWNKSISLCNGNGSNWRGVLCMNDDFYGLQLENMGLKGLIDMETLSELSSLRIISFMNNHFEGPIPEIKKLGGALRGLFLSNNQFNGEIPDDTFDGMKSLAKVYLANNGFTGKLPTSLARLPKLLDLWLENNQFEGQLPDFHSTVLRAVNVANNKFEGPIPASLSNMSASFFTGLDCQSKCTNSSNIMTILASKGVEFLISGDEKVPLPSGDGKTICLFFSANWCRPCKTFTPQLVQLYNKLRKKGENIEIVFISFDRDESGFKEHFKCMPWLSIPFDVKLHKQLSNFYHVDHIPSFIPLGLESFDGTSIVEDPVELIEDYGADAYPFTEKRREELKATDEAKRQGGKLEELLTYEGRNNLISGHGRETWVSELLGKTVGLYFGARWCPPCRAFTEQLIEAYNELLITTPNQCFEIVFVSTDRDSEEFDLNISDMPWLAIPYEDRTRQDLCRIFGIKGIPALVILGPDGKTISTNGRAMISLYGAKAFPFTEARIAEIEAGLRKEGDGLPHQVKDTKHEHILKIRRKRKRYRKLIDREGERDVDTKKSYCRKEGDSNKLVAVAIDKDKGSQAALKWAIENILNRGQPVVLVHVKVKPSALHSSQSLSRLNQISDVYAETGSSFIDSDPQIKELFLPFRCFCTQRCIPRPEPGIPRPQSEQLQHNMHNDTDFIK
ncbi:hypothetical protein F0562_035542 [Nyssa sinensis]|uniref:protein-disulfide reductase n=1 Tax=Nyssa sinensis TaxID=561372 RepID=A0A5J5AFH7_9ASTE|nr:hypothetical protein F0562_035542 [Nyssa sinensis]